MSTLPPNLPDERTARRLMDLLSQLEHASKTARPQAAPAVPSAKLTQLETENTSLRRKQHQAQNRLASLIAKLESAAEQIGHDEEEAA